VVGEEFESEAFLQEFGAGDLPGRFLAEGFFEDAAVVFKNKIDFVYSRSLLSLVPVIELVFATGMTKFLILAAVQELAAE
jgi:hypothetical protein